MITRQTLIPNYKYVPANRTTWYRWNGERRPPLKGEMYISGAIPKVYIALNDLPTPHLIAEEVNPPDEEITVNGFVYRLKGIAED